MNQKNKQLVIILSIAAVLILISALFLMRKEKQEDMGEIIATVNGNPVYDKELQDFITDFLNARVPLDINNLTDEQKKGLLTQYGVERKIYHDAEASNIASEPATKKKLEATRSAILKEAYLDKMANENITEEAINARYKTKLPELKEKVKGKKEYHASHILVKTQDEAKKVESELKTKSFAEVAKSYSIDNASKVKGGDLGFFTLDKMIKDFADKVATLSPGETSKPFSTEFGWHIVKLQEIRDAAPPSLDKIQASIRQELYYETLQKHIGELSKEVTIELKE